MREIRLSGSEGGVAREARHLYPYQRTVGTGIRSGSSSRGRVESIIHRRPLKTLVSGRHQLSSFLELELIPDSGFLLLWDENLEGRPPACPEPVEGCRPIYIS